MDGAVTDVYSIARKHLEGKTLQRKARTLLFGHQLMSPDERDELRSDIQTRTDVSATVKAKALEIMTEEAPTQKERKRNGHSVKRAAGGV